MQKEQHFDAQDHGPQDLNTIPPDYGPLDSVLREALAQASTGKGKERHARGRDFVDQPILTIGRMVGAGYPVGQLMKKGQEAVGMVARGDRDKAVAELLGVIVYAAAAVILLREPA
jgi:hypothetical protein